VDPCPKEQQQQQYGVHIGATWRIRLNHPCAAAMWPYVKLLRPVVTISQQLLISRYFHVFQTSLHYEEDHRMLYKYCIVIIIITTHVLNSNSLVQMYN